MYVPGVANAFAGLVDVELVASPKFQELLCAAGEEVLEKLTGANTQILSGAVKEVIIV